MKLRGSKLGEVQAGPDEARTIFLQMGYAHANQVLASPDWLLSLNTTDTPRIIAQADRGEFKVVFCPLKSYTSYQADRILRFYAKSYPYALVILSRATAGQWLIALSSQEESSQNKTAISVDFTNLTKLTSNKLAELGYEDESALDLHVRLAKCLTPISSLKSSASEDSDMESKRDDCRDSFNWWMRIVSTYSILSRDEEEQLARRIQDGDQTALFDLVLANLRLVVWMAKKYSWTEIPISDLIQEGNLGLLKAAQDYDLSKGHRFSTYATQWIRQHIGRAVENQMRIIRVPSHAIETLGKIQRAREKLELLGNPEPTSDDIALELGMGSDKVEALIQSDGAQPISLDTIVGDSATRLADLLRAPHQETPDGCVMQNATYSEIQLALSKLSASERSVIELRFGYGDPNGLPKTLEQVGTEIGFSRERARQLEAQALTKLRKDNRLWSTLIGEEHSPFHSPASVPVPSGRAEPYTSIGTNPLISSINLTPSIIYALCNRFGNEARLSDITRLSLDDLSHLPSIGTGKIREIEKLLASQGLKLRNQTQQTIQQNSSGQLQCDLKLNDDLDCVEIAEIAPPPLESRSNKLADSAQLSLPIEIQPVEKLVIIETTCASCGSWVVLKPSFKASWYRCRKCGDSRFVSN